MPVQTALIVAAIVAFFGAFGCVLAGVNHWTQRP